MPDHHVKGQPAASAYVREKGRVTFHTNRATPCSCSNATDKSWLGVSSIIFCQNPGPQILNWHKGFT